MIIGAVLLAFVLAIVQASFFEWAFHRYWLHRPWLPEECYTAHTLVHHQLCKHEDTFNVTEPEQEEAIHFQWWGGPVLVAINSTPWLLATWALNAAGVALPYMPFLIAHAATFFLYYLGYEGLHYLMHKPIFPVVQKSAYFRFIENHHRIHHKRMNKNLNVLLPLADLCLGSLVLELPNVGPELTTGAARRTARKHSKFGRKLAEQGVGSSSGASEPSVATASFEEATR